MNRIRVTLVSLVEMPEKVMGPEWRKEGTDYLRDEKPIVARAEPEK
jgi:hypothetical protein